MAKCVLLATSSQIVRGVEADATPHTTLGEWPRWLCYVWVDRVIGPHATGKAGGARVLNWKSARTRMATLHVYVPQRPVGAAGFQGHACCHA